MPVVDVLHGQTLFGCVASDGGRVLAPVVVLWQDLHLDDLVAIAIVLHVDGGLEWSHVGTFA